MQVKFRLVEYSVLILLSVAINGGCSKAADVNIASRNKPSVSTKETLSRNDSTSAQGRATKKEPVADTPKVSESPDLSSKMQLDPTTSNWNKQRGPLPPPHARVRMIRPLEPGDDHCLEMYTGCIGKSRDRCTSMGFFLECGERARHPKTREWVGCECPKRNN
jgi:hypothetical protein